MLKLCCCHQIVSVVLQTIDDTHCPEEQVVAQQGSLVQLPAGLCVSGQAARVSTPVSVTEWDLLMRPQQE